MKQIHYLITMGFIINYYNITELHFPENSISEDLTSRLQNFSVNDIDSNRRGIAKTVKCLYLVLVSLILQW